ncbi:histidine phosphatase family protein [Candidatus Dojkabacteria bacterium]|uniref:Histidine phosphatase family protein n=1 Tax=Candidatus Dojkabacteria bacterium TaxID=2099670 RepID=A0A955L7G6_9BACT|nr:histidine phosphatase family protein [Candidatus Dojkabacteria bacterium]
MKFILIRHGQTDINAKGDMHEHMSLAGLNQLGIQQIQSLISKLKTYGISHLYSSPEQRTIQSSFILSEALSLPFSIEQNLRERNWGEWEAVGWDNINAKLKDLTLEERYEIVPPGGESWKAVNNRLQEFLANIKKDHTEYEIIAIISHEGTLRALAPLLKDEPKEKSIEYSFENGSMTEIES